MRTKKLKGSFLGESIDFSVLSEPQEVFELLKGGGELMLQYFSFQGLTFLSHELLIDGLRTVTALDFVDKTSSQVDLSRATKVTFAKWTKNLCVGPFKSEFQKEILLGLLKGTRRPSRLIDYSELAKAAGKESAVRAAASIMSSNPWPVVFPCHRVLPKASLLRLAKVNLKTTKAKPVDVGQYGGDKYSDGSLIKKSILEIEGLL